MAQATQQKGENLQSLEVQCEGGLDLTQSIFETKPGFAKQLINFEPSKVGGYRRINGYSKYSDTIVPGTGRVLGVAVILDYFGILSSPFTFVVAARQNATYTDTYDIFTGSGSGWTQISPLSQVTTGNTHSNTTINNIPDTSTLAVGMTVTGSGVGATITAIPSSTSITISAAASTTLTGVTLTFKSYLTFRDTNLTTNLKCFLNHIIYNWTGTQKYLFTDAINYAYLLDPNTPYRGITLLNASGSASDPAFAEEFQGYIFMSGYSTNQGAIKISAPRDETDWSPVDGAAEIVIGDTITGIHAWRDQLIIFCKKSIHRIVGNSTNTFSSTPFTVQRITNKLGCLDGRSIKEINGDLLFLAQDGVRTISATVKIGDTDIDPLTRPIQEIVNTIDSNAYMVNAVVLRKKTQYRLFFNTREDNYSTTSSGILIGMRRFRDGHEDWELSQLKGFPVACADSFYSSDGGTELTIHGGFDGYVYEQENGSDLDGQPINERYTSVPFELGDRTFRKSVQRLTVYVSTDQGSVALKLNVIYDLANPQTIQPAQIALANVGSVSVYWDRGAMWDTGVTWDGQTVNSVRQNTQGSGFVVQFMFSSSDTNTSYTIQGYNIEFFQAGKR